MEDKKQANEFIKFVKESLGVRMFDWEEDLFKKIYTERLREKQSSNNKPERTYSPTIAYGKTISYSYRDELHGKGE